jgi:hypothetical protein
MAFRFATDTLYSASNLAATVSTGALDCRYLDLVSIHVKIASGGGVSWTCALQESNDGSNWVDVATGDSVTANLDKFYKVVEAPSAYYRITLTRTSGTLTDVAVYACAKG